MSPLTLITWAGALFLTALLVAMTVLVVVALLRELRKPHKQDAPAGAVVSSGSVKLVPTIYVHPSPDMSAEEIARATTATLDFDLRKGA